MIQGSLKLMLIMLTLLSSTIIKAQQFEDIKQLYSDESIYLFAESIFNINDHKVIIVKCVDTEGNIYYDDILIDPKPTDFIKRDYYIFIKVDAKNNYVSHFSTKNYHENKSVRLYIPSITVSENTFYAYFYSTEFEYMILGFDENFNSVLKWEVFNLNFPYLTVREGFLYIETFVQKYGQTIISKDTFELDNVTRWIMKRNIIEDSTYYLTGNRCGELGSSSGVEINSKGDVIVSGKFAFAFTKHMSIQGDSLFSVNGNNDGYIYKLNKNGELVYLKHLQGNGTERIMKTLITDNDEVYVIALSRNSDDSNYEGIPIHCGVDVNTKVIMKLDEQGDMVWHSYISGDENIYLDDLDESYIAIGVSYRDEIELVDTIYYGQSKFNAAFARINKLNGNIEIVKNLSNNCTNSLKWFLGSTSPQIFTVPISVTVNSDDDFHFDNMMIEPKHSNSEYKFSLFISNFNYKNVSTAEQHMAKENLFIYPNPLFSYSLLQIHSEISFHRAQLYDINGKVVLEKKGDNIREISLEDSQTIVSGVYFLKLYTENHVITKKIIIH